MTPYHEITANLHVHSIYSDGLKTHAQIARDAMRAGLDAVIVTDHNVFPEGLGGYYQNGKKRVLVIIGEEIHDIRRQPQKNHLLAIGTNHSYAHLAHQPQDLIKAIVQDGGLTFVAHPVDPELPAFDEVDLSWEDWNISGFTGLEIWNGLSELKFRVQKKLHVYFYVVFPRLLPFRAPSQILSIWDNLLNAGQHVVGIGGSDAHTFHFSFGPFRLTVFPYLFHFQTINTHILLKKPLGGDVESDKISILSALKSGNVFIANDYLHPAKGFRFFANGKKETAYMGDKIKLADGLTLHAELPARAFCRLVRNGKTIEELQNTCKIDYPVEKRGVYRLECERQFFFKQRGWIYSNPIAVTG